MDFIIKMFADTKSKNKLDLKEEAKFREALEVKRERLMKEEKANIEQERERKKGVKVLRTSGILEAYDYLLDSLIKHGLPKGDLLEYAAVTVQKYEIKQKKERMAALQDRIKMREMAAKGIEPEKGKKKKKKKKSRSRSGSRTVKTKKSKSERKKSRKSKKDR